ncbi:hypothetical protein [Aridibaculum aurantiacum]|uniref:hypothetical protein n=1 Tax=Aridibaculum aurantiacum TaxID=2810307 RepID=UPI001A97C7FF|nr:hypothetical protein [Aridibaculum aurantiacum]
MDIIIKSFNRPYYLERCIRSIILFVKGDFKITVLEDGTPPAYLDKIQELFPDVVILRSNDYQKKSTALKEHVENGKPYALSSIPVRWWVNEIRKVSDIFLLLEDDIWITSPVSLTQVKDAMVTNNMVTLKLSWHGNKNMVRGKKTPIGNGLEELVPSLPAKGVMKFLFYNPFKIISILTRTKLLDRKHVVPFYSLYTVASAFFDKKYWLYLWDNADDRVNEWQQLYKSLDWSDRNKTSRYGKTAEEVARTSFITSATNMFKDVDLDIYAFNYHLNEEWLKGNLDAMENFPMDFSEQYLGSLLEHQKDKRCLPGEWSKWIEHFKAPYKSIGCVVE